MLFRKPGPNSIAELLCWHYGAGRTLSNLNIAGSDLSGGAVLSASAEYRRPTAEERGFRYCRILEETPSELSNWDNRLRSRGTE